MGESALKIFHLTNASQPEQLKEAAMVAFTSELPDSRHTAVVRQALRDLQESGQLRIAAPPPKA